MSRAEPHQDLELVLIDIIVGGISAVAEEIGWSLIGSAFSSNIKERRDCSAAVFDPRGELVAQAEHIPLHLGSLWGTVKEILRKFGHGGIHAGDVFITNDPYGGGGSHLPDITVAQPVYLRKSLIGFVANIAHHADERLGASTSIVDEGVRIPLIKVMERGETRRDILAVLLSNYRLPDERAGDLSAQFGANQVGARRLEEIASRHGLKAFRAAIVRSLDYSELLARTAIRRLPKGRYEFTDSVDDDGLGSGPVVISTQVTIKEDTIELRFDGTSAQVRGDINAVWPATLATVQYALRALLDPDLPLNGGVARAISVRRAPGLVVDAKFPAAVRWRSLTCQRLADVIFGALASAAPDRVVAAGNAGNGITFIGNRTDGTPFSYMESIGGGSGARLGKPGLNAVQVHMTNTSNLPIEVIETEMPLMVEEYSIRVRSGGAGRWRGGKGIKRSYRALRDGIEVSCRLDRRESTPWGIFGGHAGKAARLTYRNGSTVRPFDGRRPFAMKACDVITVETPGGGGYGTPSHSRSVDNR